MSRMQGQPSRTPLRVQPFCVRTRFRATNYQAWIHRLRNQECESPLHASLGPFELASGNPASRPSGSSPLARGVTTMSTVGNVSNATNMEQVVRIDIGCSHTPGGQDRRVD